MAKGDYGRLKERLGRLSAQALSGRQIGIEKESLRVTADGRLAQTPHPPGLGSALTHSCITTDYSEALVELVTPPANETWCVLQNLVELHQFVYEQIEDEMLWCTSMPCSVSSDDDIPIANYGSSNVGMMKTIYRRGLGYRYGRMMQAIAGVHFNFSLGRQFWTELARAENEDSQDSDWISAVYLGLIRNFRRYGWLTLYLFGASPAACSSFLHGREADLEEFDGTMFGANATTLRMSDVGYQNKVQSSLQIPVNQLDEYIAGLEYATTTVHPQYERIGVVVDGEYRQLNANILQIENEYYSLIRPKRIAWSGEKPTHALRRGGIEYVEVRALDVNPFDPAGVNQHELRFLEVMLAFCALHESPPIDATEQLRIDRNQLETARHGRNPRLMLQRRRGVCRLRDWAMELCEQMLPVAESFDDQSGGADYSAALHAQMSSVNEPELTPSARVLQEMRESNESFYEFALRTSTTHRHYFRSLAAISDTRREQLSDMAAESLHRQKEIEAADSMDFATFLERYFSQ